MGALRNSGALVAFCCGPSTTPGRMVSFTANRPPRLTQRATRIVAPPHDPVACKDGLRRRLARMKSSRGSEPTNEFARTRSATPEPEAGAKAHSNGEQPGVAHQPMDRAIGSGWSMLNHCSNPDWAEVGADTHSIFRFLHSQNHSLQQTSPQDISQDTADTLAAFDDRRSLSRQNSGRSLSRQNSSCSLAVSSLENTISTNPAAAAVFC